MIRRIFLSVALALCMLGAQAQTLSTTQLQTLKAAILAETDATFVALRTANNEQGMAEWYNAAASPEYYVKRTTLSRHDIITGTSDDGTTFSWAGGAYITRSQGERDAFREMFNSTGNVNPSLTSIQAAFADIFSGTGGAGNRAHITAMSRRPASRVEKLFATGAGTKVSPSTAAFDGSITAQTISDALRS